MPHVPRTLARLWARLNGDVTVPGSNGERELDDVTIPGANGDCGVDSGTVPNANACCEIDPVTVPNASGWPEGDEGIADPLRAESPLCPPRDDEDRREQVKTVELVPQRRSREGEEKRPGPRKLGAWGTRTGGVAARRVALRIGWRERALQQRVKSAGGRWDPVRRVLMLRRDAAERLDLMSRVVGGGAWIWEPWSSGCLDMGTTEVPRASSSPWQKWSFLGFGSFSGLSSPRRPGLRMSAGWTQIAVFGSSGRQEGRIWPVGSRKGRPRGPGGPARLAVCRLRNACA